MGTGCPARTVRGETMKKILITAFEPFGGSPRNAPAEVLRLLPEEISGCEVRKLLLPVVFGKAAAMVLRREEDAVFLLGEAGGRTSVTPEQRARNLRNARIPDNGGNRPQNEPILPGRASEYRTGISVEHIVPQMRREGFSVDVSEDAGSFVCNDTFYLAGMNLRVPVDFIHCPADTGREAEYAETVRRFIELAVTEIRTLQAAGDFIRTLFTENSDGHGPDHTLRVYRTALQIAASDPEADRYIVSLGALLHDADDPKLFRTENNANARRFLEANGIPPETADRICGVINTVSFSKNRGRRPDTREGQIVQDADRLDAIGAVGIARTFSYGGKHGRPPEESIGHFHEKLLLLKDLMNTDAAREIAASRHAFMERFLEEWDRETGSRPSDPG